MDDDDLRAACRLAILKFGEATQSGRRRVANAGVYHYQLTRRAGSRRRDRIAMIANWRNASGIAGMCAAVRHWIWRQGQRILWTRWNAFIAIRPARSFAPPLGFRALSARRR